ncbi:hypothetical protein [Aureivirga marina]|uniref:hypothetical protein n=1 Tax=Aureivirga marina TaxID=1182451 RepID=UPI0018CB7F39|nr:hypothetical protein [Aureivirga marina]
MRNIDGFYNKYKGKEEIDFELIEKFFITYSRFEFALKQVEKYRKKNGKGIVEPNWEKFYSENDSIMNFEINENLKDSKEYLENYSPNSQFINDAKEVIWRNSSINNTGNDRVRIYISIIRNNLFHGGKSNNLHLERNKKLIESALIILDYLLELDPVVKNKFNQY